MTDRPGTTEAVCWTGRGVPTFATPTDGVGRIHFITTDQHPHEFPNSVYHGIIDNGRLLDSDGRIVDADLTDADAVPPEELTTILAGDPTQRGWTIDVQVDDRGHPYAVFSVHAPPRPGTATSSLASTASSGQFTQWHTPVARSSPDQPRYTGLVALDPHDPRRAVISTDAHPATGRPLVSDSDRRRHHELFAGITHDGGVHWTWTPITSNSTVDNIRPIVPIWESEHLAVLWLRGVYTTYVDYDLDVVATITARSWTPVPNPTATTCRP